MILTTWNEQRFGPLRLSGHDDVSVAGIRETTDHETPNDVRVMCRVPGRIW